MTAPLRINILTLFPGLFDGAFAHSILKRAQAKGRFLPRVIDLREFTRDRHRTADDKPYGGGSGMVMKVEPVHRAVSALRRRGEAGRVLMLAPTGRPFDQRMAEQLARERVFTLVCGRYEGVDERVSRHVCDGEISLGDYVLSGGEPAAVVVADAVVRLVPGVLGAEDSAARDSFADGLLDFPHYTRPPRYRGWRVPAVLLSGHHGDVEAWRRRQQIERTRALRPDLWERRETASRPAEQAAPRKRKRARTGPPSKRRRT